MCEPSFEYKQGEFMGVCGYYDFLKDSYWMKDSINFIFPSISEAKVSLYVINTISKEIVNLGAAYKGDKKVSDCDYFTPLTFN